MPAMLSDLRYALRWLRRSPGFTLTVLLTLALSVGANAVVFSVLNALVLRPLPVPAAGQLVSLNRLGNSGASSSTPSQSYPDYRDLRDNTRSLSGLAAYAVKRAGVRAEGSVEASWFTLASENYFDVLGLQPALGRFFHAADAHGPNGSPYIVLSYGYWQRRFHGDPHAVGRVIELDQHPFTVLGVAPASFRGTESFFSGDFWVPMLNGEQIDGYSFLEERGDHEIWMLRRLRPGASVAQAEADLNRLGRQLASAHREDEGLQFRLSRPGLLGDMLRKPAQAFLSGVMLLAALVLLAACANLGSLFAARAADRSRELALGARRAVLLRGLLLEAVLVSLAGGALGLALAASALRALSAWHVRADLPIQFAVGADGRVSALAFTLALLSGIGFGLLPLRQLRHGDAALVVKGASTERSRRWGLRDGLLLLQIVLCTVLITASLVAVRGLGRSLHTPYGFEPRGAVLANYDLQMSGRTARESPAWNHRVLDSLATVPGVTAAGFASKIPLSLRDEGRVVFREGTTDFRDSNAAADPTFYDVSPGYFAAAGTPLLAGRDFTWHDDNRAPRVAVINRVLARKLFGRTDVVGRYFLNDSQRTEVVGITEDGKHATPAEDPRAAMFLPAAQSPDTVTVLVVRSRAGEAATAAAMQRVLSTLDPNLPISISSWPQQLGIIQLPSVAATAALGVMGALAAMLAVTGIFGMASYSVSKRLRELALRMALGASRRQVLAAAFRKPARLLLAGSGLGLLLGMFASRLLAHIVYGATPADPVVIGSVVVSMAAFALLATWLPARKVLHVDPARLLREE